MTLGLQIKRLNSFYSPYLYQNPCQHTTDVCIITILTIDIVLLGHQLNLKYMESSPYFTIVVLSSVAKVQFSLVQD